MIHASHRFHGQGSLQPVYRQGQSARGSHLTLRYMLNHRRKSYRVAVVVSRKVHKSAVVRNRIRRRIYELVRQKEQAIVPSADMVFIVYSEQLASLPGSTLERIINVQLSKARLLKPAPHGIVGAEQKEQ